MDKFSMLAKVLAVATSCFAVLSAATTSLRAQKTVNTSWTAYAGNWTTASDWSCNCVPDNSSATIFEVTVPQYGDVSLDNTSSVASAAVNTLTLSLDGSLAIDNSVSLSVVGDINITDDSQVAVDSAMLKVGGNINNRFNLSFGDGAKVTVAGTVTNAGSAGNIAGPSSSFTVGPDSTLQMSSFINGNGSLTEGDFFNYGTVTVSGDLTNGARGSIFDGSASAPATISVGGNLTNHDYLYLQNPGTFTGLDVSGNLTNAGNSVYPAYLEVDEGRARVNGGLSNLDGSVDIAPEGSLSVGGTYTQTAGATDLDGTLIAPTVDIPGGELVGGEGTIQGNVTNDAIVSLINPIGLNPIGKLTINGNYMQKAGGTLLIGISSATDFGILGVSGEASLDGPAEFDFLNGYVPGANTDFAFLKAGSLTGDFTSLDFTGIKCPSCTFNLSTLSLDTGSTPPSKGSVPEPATLVFFATGLPAVAIFLRNKQRSVHSCS